MVPANGRLQKRAAVREARVSRPASPFPHGSPSAVDSGRRRRRRRLFRRCAAAASSGSSGCSKIESVNSSVAASGGAEQGWGRFLLRRVEKKNKDNKRLLLLSCDEARARVGTAAVHLSFRHRFFTMETVGDFAR